MNARPNIVLVHGAWADGSSWSGVIERLQAAGYHVTAPHFPMSSLAADVALGRIRALLDQGATVIGSRPGSSPSLADDPVEHARVVRALWETRPA